MRVLVLSRVTPAHGPGGLAASTADLCAALARAGAEVRLLTTRGGDAAAIGPGVQVQALSAPAACYSPAWWRESVQTWGAQADWPQAVLSVSAAGNAVARRTRTAPGRPPFVFQAHGCSAGEVVSKLRAATPRAAAGVVKPLYWGLLRDRAYQDYDAVSAVGEAVRRQLLAWPTRALVGATPVQRIPNGVEARAFRFDPDARRTLRAKAGLAGDATLVLFAGRLQADKGGLEAVESFALALRRRSELRLAVAGDGPEAAALDRRLLAPDVAGRAWRLGALGREALAGWLSAADALLFPTRRVEGLPLVVLEALAAGLPVLTTPEGAADPELPVMRLGARDICGFADALATLTPAPAPALRASRLPPLFTLEASACAHLRLFEALCARAAQRRAEAA